MGIPEEDTILVVDGRRSDDAAPPAAGTEKAVRALPGPAGRADVLPHFRTDREGVEWYAPAFRKRLHDQASSLLEELRQLASDTPARSWHLLWSAATRACAAADELEDAEQAARARLEELTERARATRADLDGRIGELKTQVESRHREYDEARAAYGAALGKAGIPFPPEGDPGLQQVQAALDHAVLDIDETAGAHHVIPPAHGERKSSLGRMIHALAVLFSWGTTGFLIALCLGSVVGMVSMADLKRGDYGRLLFMTGVGIVIVWYMGELWAHTTEILARNRESRRSPERAGAAVSQVSHEEPPRLRGGVYAGALVAASLVLWTAEVVVEAIGLRVLFDQIRLMPGGEVLTDHGMWAYFLAGAIISGPYVWAKTAGTWKECEARLMESWLAYRRQMDLRDLRGSDQVARCFAEAARVEGALLRLRHSEAELKEALQRRESAMDPALDRETRARLDYALGAALGESQRLHALVEGIVEDLEYRPAEEPRRPMKIWRGGNGRR